MYCYRPSLRRPRKGASQVCTPYIPGLRVIFPDSVTSTIEPSSPLGMGGKRSLTSAPGKHSTSVNTHRHRPHASRCQGDVLPHSVAILIGDHLQCHPRDRNFKHAVSAANVGTTASKKFPPTVPKDGAYRFLGRPPVTIIAISSLLGLPALE